MYMTKEEAAASDQHYEATRCKCGGSPLWVDPHLQRRLATCTALWDVEGAED